MNEEKESDGLSGMALRIFLRVAVRGSVGVRETQRAFRMSNPSLALYYLKSLVKMGLLRFQKGNVGYGVYVLNGQGADGLLERRLKENRAIKEAMKVRRARQDFESGWYHGELSD